MTDFYVVRTTTPNTPDTGLSVTTGANLGAGEGIFAQKNGYNIELKSIVAGSNITLTPSATEITIAATGGGGGEANTSSNVGTGEGLAKAKSGVDLPFKSLVAGSARLTLTGNANDVTIDVPSTAFHLPGGTDVPVADGGTGASDASGARTNLGLAIGTNVQAFDAQLSDLAALSYAGNTLKVVRVNAGETAFELATLAGGGDVAGPASATDNAIARYDGTGGKTLQNSGVTIDDAGTITLLTGTTTAPALIVPAGTLMTTPSDGAIEADANCLYATTDAGNRGYIPVVHYIRADSTRTLPNDLNENAIFNSPANGRLTLETGVYLFDGLISVSSMSATSGNALLDILGAGTATCAAWLWHAVGADGNANTAATQTGSTTNTQQSAASIVTAGTGAAMHINIKGTFEVTGAGTLIPSIDQVTAAAAVVAIGSYFQCWRIGSTTAVSVGQWD